MGMAIIGGGTKPASTVAVGAMTDAPPPFAGDDAGSSVDVHGEAASPAPPLPSPPRAGSTVAAAAPSIMEPVTGAALLAAPPAPKVEAFPVVAADTIAQAASAEEVASATPAAPAAQAASTSSASFVPIAFLWNDEYYTRMADAPSFDTGNIDLVMQRFVTSSLVHLRDAEHEEDASITDVPWRRIDPERDGDLRAINPDALWYARVRARTGTGAEKVVPVVINTDGATFVDPRLKVL